MGFFQAILQHCLDQYVPFKKVYCKYSKRPTPWLTPELFTAIHDKQKAKVRTECARDPGNFEQYRRLKNKLKMQIKSAKLKHLRGILERMKDNPHSAFNLWQAINQIIGRSSTIKPKLPGNLSLDSINDFFVLLLLLLNMKMLLCLFLYLYHSYLKPLHFNV